MKKIITISLLLSSILMAVSPIHDKMDSRLKGLSFGGTNADNLAAEDGLGILPLQSVKETRDISTELQIQKVFQKLLSSENDKTKILNIKTSISTGILGTVEDKNYLSNLGYIIHIDGETCDDGNIFTHLDQYLNGKCIGTVCNDHNSNTIDFWLGSESSGSCQYRIPDNTCENGFIGTYSNPNSQSLFCKNQTQEQFNAKFSKLTKLYGHMYIESPYIYDFNAISKVDMGPYKIFRKTVFIGSNPKIPMSSKICQIGPYGTSPWNYAGIEYIHSYCE